MELKSFLDPTVERFLGNAEDRLRSHRVKNRLLICRNDGALSPVGEWIALSGGGGKTLAMVPVVFGVVEYA